MNLVVRRRLAIGAVAASAALVGGLVVAPQVLASAGGLTVTPNGSQNTNPALVITYKTTEADLRYGGTATFTRVGSTVTFTAPIDDPTGTQLPGADREQSGEEDLTDEGDGLGIDGPADAGSYNVSVTGGSPPIPATQFGGGGNDTCTSCFTVLPAGQIAVTGVTPTSLRPGAKDNMTIAGDSFERNSKVEFLLADGTVDSGITLTLPTASAGCTGTAADDKITTKTAIKRCATVAASSTPGLRNVRVTNLDGNTATCAACFFVSGPPLTSVNPTAAFNDPAQALTAITFTGSNVTNGTPSLEYVGPAGGTSKSALALVGTNVRDYTSTSITADFDLSNAAPGGSAYQPFVRGADGIVNACDNCRFTVVQRDSRTPTITSLDSDTATVGIQKDIKQGETKTFQVAGTNFSKGATLVVLQGTAAAAGITVTNVDFVSPELLRATISATSAAAAGAKDVQVKLTDGKTSNTCTGCLNVVSTATPTPTPTGTRSPSATPTSTISPSPQGCPGTPVRVRVNTKTINATGQASVTVTGATPSATIELQGYSQNHEGTASFANDPTPVDRVGKADANGSITFNDLRPASNTRVRARQQGCTFGNSDVIEVRAQETLAVKRTGTRSYTFSGRSIPARPGGLIISLYRIVGTACAAGVEPSKCPGEKFIGQGRAVSLGSPGEGLYSIRITFPAADQNVRDEFVVKTGRDAQNAPGRSNARSLLIN
jgi:hypothetical protein